jgi:hypothetical protein
MPKIASTQEKDIVNYFNVFLLCSVRGEISAFAKIESGCRQFRSPRPSVRRWSNRRKSNSFFIRRAFRSERRTLALPEATSTNNAEQH